MWFSIQSKLIPIAKLKQRNKCIEYSLYLLGFCKEKELGLPDLFGAQVLSVDHPLQGSVPSQAEGSAGVDLTCFTHPKISRLSHLKPDLPSATVLEGDWQTKTGATSDWASCILWVDCSD